MSGLFVVSAQAVVREVSNSYTGIKDGLGGAVLDFIVVSRTAAFYIDDNGMLEDQPLNVAASFFAGRPLYGPVVLASSETTADGDTLPPDVMDVQVLRSLADQWARVIANAADLGQDLTVRPNADTIPPPQIIELTHDELERRLRGER